MKNSDDHYQFAIIGGGFFGCAIALHLRRRGFERIVLVERESQLLTRASYRNQARVHNGYHYPRSYKTAYRSRVNMPRFCTDYGFAVKSDFTALYALASHRSKVIETQFERFMHDIGAAYETAGSGYSSLFDPTHISGVYVVQEYAFDAARLREHFQSQLTEADISVLLNTEAVHLARSPSGDLKVEISESGSLRTLSCERVFNCTYAALNHTVISGSQMTALKHEIAEIALIEPPPQLSRLGVTVMDGPFFSCMPFPAAGCHSLTHVRYTPHGAFIDDAGLRDPVKEADSNPRQSHAPYMIADAARMLPCLRSARWRQSLFEVKTVLVRNEADDGRPVLLRREPMHPHLFSVLGAKIDNVYDVLERIDWLLENTGAFVSDLGGESHVNDEPYDDRPSGG